ncbi:glycoside hydrolase superfamily [Russula brevipes]|nr:glycoside hydrolase superfamily [Russula brevipes]
MAGASLGVGVDGSRFTHYDYPGIYQYQDFHHCGLRPGDNIANYGNAVEVWTCQLSGLATTADYTNDLISLGVDGLRLDASKHMNPVDIANILSRLSTRPYITQEVIYGDGEAVTPDMYVGNGGVQEFRYTSALKKAFIRDGIQWLQDFDHRGWVPRSGANVFVANHDTERTCPNACSAHPYGVPTVLSSYSNFYHADSGSPNGGMAHISDFSSFESRPSGLCQHRWTAIAGMVGFRNNVNANINPLTRWVAPSPQQIAFARGTAGFVAINNVDDPWSTTFSTGLPTGSTATSSTARRPMAFAAEPCKWKGRVFWVGLDGNMSVTINPRQAIAIHVGARGVAVPIRKSAEQVSVLFYVTAMATPGEDIYVAGSVPQLGNWDLPTPYIRLDPTNYPVWAATAYLPPSTHFEYKLFRKKFDGHIEWENDPNRQDSTSVSDMIWIRATWR